MSSKYIKTSESTTSPTLADKLGIGDRYKKKPKKKEDNASILKYFKDLMKGAGT